MSHVVGCDLVVTNLDDLEVAAKACGLELRRGQKTYKWYGRYVGDYNAADAAYKRGIAPADYGKCEHALSLPGSPISPVTEKPAYEVGVIKNPNGPGWIFNWDFFDNMLLPAIGQGACKLGQAVAEAAIVRTARIQRNVVHSRQTLPDGRVQVKIRRPVRR